ISARVRRVGRRATKPGRRRRSTAGREWAGRRGRGTALTCAGLPCAQGGHMTRDSNMARSAQVLRFVLKHRKAGLFNGPAYDATAGAVDTVAEEDPEVGPQAFVRDLEALGPTFIKVGQSLSTRHDMVPPGYLAALERMQDDVQPVPAEAV